MTTPPHDSVPSASIETLPASSSPSTAVVPAHTAVALPTMELSDDDNVSSNHPATLSLPCAIGCFAAVVRSDHGHVRQIYVIPACNAMGTAGSVAAEPVAVAAPAAGMTRYGFQRLGSSALGEEDGEPGKHMAALHDGSTLSVRGAEGVVAETLDQFLAEDNAALEASINTGPASHRDSFIGHPNLLRSGQRGTSSLILGEFERAATSFSGLFLTTTNSANTELVCFAHNRERQTSPGAPATPMTDAFSVVQRSSTQVLDVAVATTDEAPELAVFAVVEPFFGFTTPDVFEASFVQMPMTASANDDVDDVASLSYADPIGGPLLVNEVLPLACFEVNEAFLNFDSDASFNGSDIAAKSCVLTRNDASGEDVLSLVD